MNIINNVERVNRSAFPVVYLYIHDKNREPAAIINRNTRMSINLNTPVDYSRFALGGMLLSLVQKVYFEICIPVKKQR